MQVREEDFSNESVTNVSFRGFYMTQELLDSVMKRLPKLKHLDLSDCQLKSPTIDCFKNRIEGMSLLESLELCFKSLSDQTSVSFYTEYLFNSLPSFPNLRRLRVKNCHISKDALNLFDKQLVQTRLYSIEFDHLKILNEFQLDSIIRSCIRCEHLSSLQINVDPQYEKQQELVADTLYELVSLLESLEISGSRILISSDIIAGYLEYLIRSNISMTRLILPNSITETTQQCVQRNKFMSLPIFKEEMYQLLKLGRIFAGMNWSLGNKTRLPPFLFCVLLETLCPLMLSWETHKTCLIIDSILERETVGMLRDEKLKATPNSLFYLVVLSRGVKK